MNSRTIHRTFRYESNRRARTIWCSVLWIVLCVVPVVAHAQEQCAESIEAARAAVRSRNCSELERAADGLRSFDDVVCQQWTRTVQTALKNEACGCDALKAALHRAAGQSPDPNDCAAARTTVAELSTARGCHDDAVREQARVQRTRFQTLLESPTCREQCSELPERIRTSTTTEARTELQRHYLSCPEDVRTACGIQPNPRPLPADTTQLLEATRHDLARQNQDFLQDPACAKQGACPQRESDRLAKLTEYLELLRKAPDPIAKQEHPHALQLLLALGAPDSVLRVLLALSEEELQGFAALKRVRVDPVARARLIEELGSRDDAAFAPLIDALKQGADLSGLLQLLEEAREDVRQGFFRDTRLAIGGSETVLEWYRQQLEESQLEVVRPLPSHSGSCSGCDQFWGAFQAHLTGTQPPTWIAAEDPVARFVERVRARTRVCANPRASSVERGCGAVVLVEVHPKTRDTRFVKTRIASIVPSTTATGVAVRAEELPVREFQVGLERHQEQRTIAFLVADSLAAWFHRHRSAPITEQRALRLSPRKECGVTVTEGDEYVLSPPRAVQVTLGGSCGNPQFHDALRRNLEAYDWGKRDVRLSPPADNQQCGSQRGPPGFLKCCVGVGDQSKPLSVNSYYSVAVLVNAKEACAGRDLDTKWRSAGEQAAVQVVRYMASLDTRPRRAPPPFHHALYLSGARQLEASNWENGWGWVVAESTLILASATFTVLAVRERNAATPVERNVDTVNLYHGLSYGALGAIVPLRLFAGWSFTWEEP